MRKSIFCGLAGILLCLSACTVEYIGVAPVNREVRATIADPLCGNLVQTRAISDAFKFSFSDDDGINVFPKAGGNASMTYFLTPDESNQSKAKFQQSVYTMSDGTYTALYPSQNIPKDITAIALDFSGQAQSVNGSTSHLAAYDYCWAEADIEGNAGSFDLAHKVVWLKVSFNASEAVNFRSLTVSANEGVAGRATIDATTGTLTPSRSAGDVITLSLGGTSGIDVAADECMVAFVTIPAGVYTDLAVKFTDSSANNYVYARSGAITLAAGKYYTLTVQKDGSEAFKNVSAFGAYDLSGSSVSPVIAFDEDTFQMSYGHGTGVTTFKLADLGSGYYAIIQVSSATITEGATYTVSANVNGTVTSGSFKAVKKADGYVWLENDVDNIGYVIAVE